MLKIKIESSPYLKRKRDFDAFDSDSLLTSFWTYIELNR